MKEPKLHAKLGWFGLLWLLSVGLLAIVAFIIRAMIM